MKAAFIEGLGKGFVVRLTERPDPKQGQVLVHVLAAGLNHLEDWIRKGAFPELPYPIIAGSDGAGIIVECGAGVDVKLLHEDVIINPALSWGLQEMQDNQFNIFGLGSQGSFAEYVAVPSENVRKKPQHLSFEQAAALPMAGLTAYRALFRRGKLKKHQKVFITGIGGGVAMLALQFAIAAGCSVYVSSSSDEKLLKAKTIGAAGGVNYHNEHWIQDLLAMAGKFDVILDSAGGATLCAMVDLARVGGTIVSIGMTTGGTTQLDIQKLFSKQLTIVGSMMGSPRDFDDMLAFVENHEVFPVIDDVVELDQINRLFEKNYRGEKFGKSIVRFSQKN
jgi:NADPH:quinone reductase-like Zn-dependent oxidoreductase